MVTRQFHLHLLLNLWLFHIFMHVIDIMDTTIIIINIRGGLIKTHAKFIRKCCFLWLENFSMKAKIDYDKGYFDWMIELSTSTKVITIPTFDHPMKLHFLPKDNIHNFFCHMLQPLLQPPLILLLLECTVTLITSLSY